MADVAKTIEIIFAGTDKVSGTIGTVSGGLSDLGSKVESIAAPLSGVADKVIATDMALAALAVGGLTFAFLKSKDYESAIIDLEKVMGENEEVTKELESQFTSLSRTYGESTIAIVNSLAGLRQSGYDTAEGMNILETSMMLARASELSAEEATNLLKRSLIGYNLTSEEAIKLGDLWNQTSNVANTTVGKLAEGFAVVSRQASDAGFSLSETSAVLTPIIGVFDSGSEAGIAFSMALTRMLNPTKEGEAAIRALTGVSGPLNQEFATGKDLFEAVAIGLSKVDAQTGGVYTAQIVGAQQAKRIKVAFDDYAETLEKIGPASAQYNSLQKEVDIQNASTQASVDRLIVGFSALASAIGDQFREGAKEAVDGGTAIENALEDIIKSGTFDSIFDALDDFGFEIGKYLKGIAKAMPEAFEDVDFGGLLDAFGDLGEEFGEMFADVDLTDPEDLKEAIQFVIDSLESLVRTTKGMVEVFGPLIADIIETAKGFNLLDDETKESAGNLLGIAKAITGLGVKIGLMLVTIGQHAETMKLVFEVVIGSIGFMWDSAVLIVEAIFMAVALGVEKLSRFLSKITWGDLSKSFEIVTEDARIFKEAMGEDIASRAEANLKRLNKAFGSTGEKIKETTKNVKDFAKTDAEIALQVETDRAELQKVADEIFGFVDGVKVDVDKKKPTVKVVADTIKATRAVDSFYMKMVEIDGEMVEVKVYTDCDTTDAKKKIAEVKKDVEEFPKELEIKLKGEIDTEIARMKEQGEIAQTAMKWTAKLNIAEAEADAKVLVAVFDGIAVSVKSTGDALGGLFGLLTDPDTSTWDKWAIEDQIKKENELREKAFEQQSALNAAQLEYMEAKTAALEAGEGLITITADGLEPEIEAFMWKIIEKVQIRASEAQAEFLLGIT